MVSNLMECAELYREILWPCLDAKNFWISLL